MFIIQLWKSSICQTVLLITLLVFTSADMSTSNQRICEKGNTRNISYFKLYDKEVNWSEAWSLCNNRSFSLPVICNQYEQDTLTNYLRANGGGRSAAWTSGKRIAFDKWRWVDGQIFNSAIQVAHTDYTHVVLDRDRSYKAEYPGRKIYYLCQYSGSSCNSENVINLTNGCCVRPSDDDRSWYDARNQCLKHDSELAILTDADLLTLRGSNKLNSVHSYWIGLRKNTWQWMWQGTDGSGEEVKYTNWPKGTLSSIGECISIDASNGEWKASGCMDSKKVVCVRIHTSSSTETSTRSMSNMSSKLSQSISESTTQTMTEAHSNICSCSVLLTAVVIVGLCVIVISNIIVALVVRKNICRRAKASSNTEATETKCYQDLETTRRQANPDSTYTELQLQPVYEEVSKRGH